MSLIPRIPIKCLSPGSQACENHAFGPLQTLIRSCASAGSRPGGVPPVPASPFPFVPSCHLRTGPGEISAVDPRFRVLRAGATPGARDAVARPGERRQPPEHPGDTGSGPIGCGRDPGPRWRGTRRYGLRFTPSAGRAHVSSPSGSAPPVNEHGVDPEALWQAADKLRGSVDAAEYKHVVLGLIFLKYISDVFAARRTELAARLEADGIAGKEAEGYSTAGMSMKRRASSGFPRKRDGSTSRARAGRPMWPS